tara:strand:+ start:45 stop:686 length:642 start_codon:yes stop_codon:yes gene_type:complete
MGRLKKTKIKDWTGYVVGYECKKKQIQIVMCDKHQADSIIIKYHYSKKPTKNSFLNMLVIYENKVSGALQIGYGIRPNKNKNFKKGEVVEFDRMWLSDNMPKYSETITLSLLNNFLKNRYKNLKAIISYSDTSVGNNGTIYKAGNYKLIDKHKVDFYITQEGERIHPVTMWHRHKTRAWDFLKNKYPNIKKANGYQLKYIYYLKTNERSKISK